MVSVFPLKEASVGINHMAIMDYDEFLSSLAYNKIVDLSATSVALLLSSITLISNRYNWERNGNALNDTEWDYIDSVISLANGELMSALVGLVVPAVFATASAFKFIPCDGGVYNKDDYPLLYDAIDSQFIISGTQFTVPDLRNRSVVGAGDQYNVGDSGGSDSVQLSVSEIPSHSHGFTQYTFGVDIESVGVPDPTGVGQPRIPEQTDMTGGGDAHENRSPYYAMNWYIVAG